MSAYAHQTARVEATRSAGARAARSSQSSEARPCVEFSDLSTSERDISAQYVAGATAVSISRTRGTSVATVRKQIQTVFEKLDIHSRRELRDEHARRANGRRTSRRDCEVAQSS